MLQTEVEAPHVSVWCVCVADGGGHTRVMTGPTMGSLRLRVGTLTCRIEEPGEACIHILRIHATNSPFLMHS